MWLDVMVESHSLNGYGESQEAEREFQRYVSFTAIKMEVFPPEDVPGEPLNRNESGTFSAMYALAIGCHKGQYSFASSPSLLNTLTI